VKGKNIL